MDRSNLVLCYSVTHSTPATLASLLFLEDVHLAPTSSLRTGSCAALRSPVKCPLAKEIFPDHPV